MSSNKISFISRLIASMLSVLMVFSIMPLSPLNVLAATAEHPGSITITVTDEEGTPISGASVTFTVDSEINGLNYKSGNVSTDDYGTVEILASSDYVENDISVSATITKEHFKDDSSSVSNTEITSSEQNFEVSLVSTLIEDVTVTPTSVPYDGNEYNAATITGLQTGDVVSYKLNNGNWQNTMPTISSPYTSYSLSVKVERTDYETYETLVTPVVTFNTIQLNVIKYQGDYDAESHPALSVEGLLSTDDVTYSLNGATPTQALPYIEDVGNYQVAMHVERYGYNDFDATYDNIGITAIDIGGLSATAYSAPYDGEYHDAATVTGTVIGDTVEYRLDNGIWQSAVPQIKDYKEGGYKVEIRVTRDSNYNVTDLQVVPANAFVSKVNQTLSFTNSSYNTSAEGNVTLDKSTAANNVYDFSVVAADTFDDDVNSNAIVYTIENAADDGLNINDIATIDTEGKVTVKSAGCVIVKAKRLGNGNYNDGEITYTLTTKVSGGNLVSFAEENIEYIIGKNDGVVSELTASKANPDDNGTLSYSISKTNIGLAIDSVTGKVTVIDYNKLANEMTNNNGSVSVVVTVNKSAGTKGTAWWKKEVYASDSATYTISVSFLPTPATPYTLNGTQGTNDWYTTTVTVSATDSTNYTISKTCELSGFGTSVAYSDQGVADRYIYLRNVTNGGITARILLEGVKIDTENPDYSKMNVSYSQSVSETILGVISLGFYKPSATVTFTAEDVTSGVDHFNWTYTKESGASTINKATDSGSIVAVINGTTATAQIIITADEAEQYRGSISFTATDKAGNESDTVTDEKNVLIVDTISPTRNVVISNPKTTITDELTSNKTLYFDGNATITFNVEEANFFAADVKVTYTQNGGTPITVPTSSLNWTDNADVHIGTLILSDEGDYTVNMTYTDRSTNEMESYESDLITIDTTIPVIDFSYEQENQSTTFTVTEHNFRAKDISVSTLAKDITGADVTAKDLNKALHDAQWIKNGDVYTTTLSDYVNAIYNLTISYTDISTNMAVDKESGDFIIDHSAPTGTKIEYSTSILDTVLETLTLGFYNPSVIVTFTAYDTTAGIDYFTWNYTKQNGTSTINHPASIADTKIEAIQDSTDKTKFSAQYVLTASEAEQYRGYLAVTATDTYENIGEKVTDDGNILVVDTISPTMTVEYNESSQTVGTNMYYNKAATATFTVTEANFFKEDVKVTVSKNGDAAYDVTPTWVDTNVDVHLGTLVLPAANDHSNDGHYIINVTYKDRSNNTMTAYTSDTITIDTINPTVDVVYSNQDVKNTLPDSDNNSRQYFANTQTATITVTEHNFNAEEVNFDIIAKDVTGTELNNDNLLSQSAWTTSGDNHTIVITYSGDANYTFDVSYTDLATNEMADYSNDYFTVDKTAPANLTVTYSTSVLDTVLESVSFGFYNAKMTVTITADDTTSKINSFDYSYIKAAGVSSVNADLLAEAIAEAGITYSNGNATATIRFEIPKMVLGNDNQFNGTVEFTAKDRSGNSTEKKNTQRIVVDNIAPTSTVSYNEPVNTENGISYYAGNVNATINITEANFYSADVAVVVSKDGGTANTVNTSWIDNSVDSHTGTFTLSEDGDYIVTITYRDKSNNEMIAYTSNQLTIDTKIEAPVITINGTDGDGHAYKDNVVPAISFEDQNYDSYEVILTQTRFGNKNVDVTDKFIGTSINVTDNEGSGSFNTFEKVAENDGIYTLTVKLMDKAGHDITQAITFTVNRFGSVYKFSDKLNSLIADGGAYVKSMDSDLVVTEYNADKLIKDSLLIEITKDGKPVSNVEYMATPTINDTVSIGESGWYQYEYTIAKENFASDGVYKMTISSKDQTGNAPENTNYEDQSILFRVDSTPAEITSITGLEESIINAQEVTVKYNIYDTIGLASAVVYIDDKAVDTIDDFSGDQNNYSGSFIVSESSKAQIVKLVVTDIAGNIIDTSSEGFEPKYAFNSEITISTNIFVRWYANRIIFWSSIGGVVVLGAGIGLFVALRKKKKKVK